MGFAENMEKLVVSNGDQLKIKDKDKAIMEIAKEITELPKMAKIISIWESDNGVFTKLQSVSPDGNKPQVFNFNSSATKRLYLCDDENEPQNDESNVVSYTNSTARQINTQILKPLKAFYQQDTFDSDNNKLNGFMNFYDESDFSGGIPDFVVNVNN